MHIIKNDFYLFQKLRNLFLYTKLVHNEHFMIPKSNNLMRTWDFSFHMICVSVFIR